MGLLDKFKNNQSQPVNESNNNSELAVDDLDAITAGYMDRKTAIENEIERLSKELNNPANDANYRVAVYKQIEKLQEELQDFQISNRVR